MTSILLLSLLVGQGQPDFHLIARSRGIAQAWDCAPVCCDYDGDDTVEVMYHEHYRPAGLVALKFDAANRIRIAHWDTEPQVRVPHVLYTSRFEPYDARDMNGDGIMDLVGVLPRSSMFDNNECGVAVTTSRSPGAWPDTCLWWHQYGVDVSTPITVSDLDQDSLPEIICSGPIPTSIREYRPVNRFDSVAAYWCEDGGGLGWPWGDFDSDGRMEFVAFNGSGGTAFNVFKCMGNDTYRLVSGGWMSLPNGSENSFSGHAGSTPVFFFSPWDVFHSLYYLYMGRWVSGDSYAYTHVYAVEGADHWGRESKCGDLDGDGIDEVVWSIGDKVLIFRWNGTRFDLVWTWHRPFGSCSLVNIYDLNRDGYNEFLISGTDSTYYFEVKGVVLTRPNGGEEFLPGDSVSITWETFSPPRCDSVALFYSLDSSRTWLPIARGLSPGDTGYTWVAPDVRSTTCLIKVVTYGPGSVFDESDSCFSIVSTAAGGSPDRRRYRTELLGSQPNPVTDRFRIRFALSEAGRVRLRLCDVTGRTVAGLVDDLRPAGVHESTWLRAGLTQGVYFLEFDACGRHQSEKVIVE